VGGPAGSARRLFIGPRPAFGEREGGRGSRSVERRFAVQHYRLARWARGGRILGDSFILPASDCRRTRTRAFSSAARTHAAGTCKAALQRPAGRLRTPNRVGPRGSSSSPRCGALPSPEYRHSSLGAAAGFEEHAWVRHAPTTPSAQATEGSK
jgi:hypothetical protein